MAASTSANDTPATSAHLTGQQSLQKATIALKGLQRKYGQAGSTPHGNSSSDFLRISQQASSALGSAADTEAALEVAAAPSASRSSFEFRPVVGLRGATRMSEGVYPSSLLEEGHPSRVSEGATRVSERAHPSREPEEAHSSRVSDKAHPCSSADESPLAGSLATGCCVLACHMSATLCCICRVCSNVCNRAVLHT